MKNMSYEAILEEARRHYDQRDPEFVRLQLAAVFAEYSPDTPYETLGYMDTDYGKANVAAMLERVDEGGMDPETIRKDALEQI